PVSKLSGGEQARLRIAQMMLTPANILVLDEPTNDLDMATLAVLEETLADFPGAVILVTHDRYFLDQVSNRILAFEQTLDNEPELLEFASFPQWEDWREIRDEERKVHLKKNKGKAAADKAAAMSASAAARETAAAAEVAAVKKPARKLSFKERHELDTMEANIATAEAKLASLQAEAADPNNAANAKRLTELYAEIATAQTHVEKLYARWSELEN
ncbi:MAG: ATP-binding cassette domain-containing protein, partial [Proteobacteria bacterium]